MHAFLDHIGLQRADCSTVTPHTPQGGKGGGGEPRPVVCQADPAFSMRQIDDLNAQTRCSHNTVVCQLATRATLL